MCPSLTYFSAADASWRILTYYQYTSCHSSYIFLCCHFLELSRCSSSSCLMTQAPSVSFSPAEWLCSTVSDSFSPSHSSSISELLWCAAWSADLCQPQLIKSDTSFETASWVCHALPKSARTLFHLFFFFFWQYEAALPHVLVTSIAIWCCLSNPIPNTALDNTIHPASLCCRNPSPWQQISSLSETD